MSESIIKELEQGIQEMGLVCPEGALASLLAYLKLLKKWNSSFNLSGVSDVETMVSRHLLDSLAVSPHLCGKLFIDIGSGAGLPGIPLAILNPDKHFILIDSNGKKTRFLFQAKIELNLDNITVENSRVEHYQSKQQIDMVMCRAFSTLEGIVTKIQPLFSSSCKLLAMKGHYPEDEITELPVEFEVTKTIKLKIPGSDSQRHLIEIMHRK
ncbi:MAG: 16S rRNA (guanine(527)-N(7))-methyltransferase RsmG [SAR86 cluster bacterium]|uniref:Ribosomal RNA small subunit methyltransferase G n=1 Tax=SAR86 cluster bacterium TaxID=2030880 RepID=A0A2A5AYC1_9GAMM|nr:MAG: 16S rRNA (guanine(527)-N(7))-methyltransferase RsmG [SAR86 cluster bacterium]